MKILERYGWIIALALALIFAFSPLIARVAAGNPVVAAGDSYYNLRMAESIQNDPLLQTDSLQNRPYNFNLYHYFLALPGIFFSDQALLMTSIIFSLLSAYFLLESMKNFGMGREESLLSLIVYLFTPLYSYLSTTLTAMTLTLFLLTASLYLFSRKQRFTSLLPAALTVLTNPTAFLMFFLTLTIYSYYRGEKYRPIFSMFLAGTGIFLLFNQLLQYLPQSRLGGGLSFHNYITDFGALIGYPFFTVLLAIVALVIFWDEFDRKIAHVGFLALLLLSTTMPASRLVINIPIAVYAAYALKFFLEREWRILSLRDLTLLILFSSLLFSGVSFNDRIASMEPTADTVSALEAIMDSKREGKIITSPQNGFLAEYYTDRPAYTDELSYYYSDYEEKKETAEKIFTSSSPTKTKQLLTEANITYIYIDQDMKERYWERDDGLTLVLDLSENFIKLSEFQQKESWLYIRI